MMGLLTIGFKCLFCLNLFLLAQFDWKRKLLPVEWMIGSIVLFGAMSLLIKFTSLYSSGIGFLVGFGFLGLQFVLSRGRWIGGGDPWMGGLIGIVLGWPFTLIALFLTYVCGAIVSLGLFATGHATKKTRIPFAPFLTIGAYLTLVFGHSLFSFFSLHLGL